MKTFIFPGLMALLLSASPSPAQTAGEAQIETARKELEATSREYQGMRTALYREINTLDDEVLKLSRELKELEREEAMRTSKQRTTERNTQILRANFDYAVGVLRQYGDNLTNRLHAAENQIYREKLQSISEAALAAKDDPEKEMEARLEALEIGLKRLPELAGGQRFQGKAMRNGTEAKEGEFMLLGPAAYFRSSDGEFEGVTTFEENNTGIPTAVGVKVAEDGMIATAVSNGAGHVPFDPTLGKALKVEAAEESLIEVIEAGGIVGHAILLLGLVALGLTVFKVLEITRFPVPSRRKINEIIDDLVSDRQEEARKKAAGLQGMSGEMVRTGVERFYEKRRVLEESLFEKMVSIKPRLDRFLPFLGLTAAAAPLMGLLGTVLGIIKTFKAMALDSGNKQAFTVGISEALITTAEGLVVAIPVLVLHGMMKSLAKGKFSEIESIGIALINGTTELTGGEKSVMGTDEGEDDDSELVPNPA
ncbi:MotA/TolQ/ExbB proton channel family protein [Haloferula chungangensis]|uniref:MotA/TolQ/ExbB proton channel family protein n=1 Tax=Haloferula chungangensis TaxID=1048331 RepID=A0ABW2LA60_9BACT